MNDVCDGVLSTLAICAFAAVLTSPVACTMHRNAKLSDAIKAGADPIEARCAVTDDFYTPICMLRVAVRK